MADSWREALRSDPIAPLLSRGDPALTYHVRRDLLGELAGSPQALWELTPAIALVSKQLQDGSWRYPGKLNAETGANYDLLETFRHLRTLVEQYAFTIEHPSIKAASEYLFGQQTEVGDIRGILGNQYMPYYHGAILELLIKAGLAGDDRVARGLGWLLSVRGEDGGWIVPAQAVPASEKTGAFWRGPALPPDRSRPFSHLATGMVLRAFAAHPEYRRRPDVQATAVGLKGRFFRPDRYNDRKAPTYWLKFQFPFWWTNLLSALDSLWRLEFSLVDPDVAMGLDWFIENQAADGLWETGYGSGSRAEPNRAWVGLAACRVLKGFSEGPLASRDS